MKKLYSGILCAALVLASVTLTACKEKIKVDVHLTYDASRDALVEDNLGLEYNFASVSYEPATYTVPYADWDDVVLYTVKGWDPADLLTEEYSGIGGLLYAADKPLPEIADMNCNTAIVCTVGAATIGLSTIDDKSVIDTAVDMLTAGELVDLPEDGHTTYHLKFHSDDYAGIYYNVLFIMRGEGEDGDYFLYDRGTKRCVEVPYDLFYGWIYDDSEDTLPTEGIYDVTPGEDGIEIGFGDQ
ncbi:MAG: hypothetical protein IKZ09_02030 [Clostridia bacterium]|nr:hypothetical protein [Clostridia bacterium]